MVSIPNVFDVQWTNKFCRTSFSQRFFYVFVFVISFECNWLLTSKPRHQTFISKSPYNFQTRSNLPTQVSQSLPSHQGDAEYYGHCRKSPFINLSYIINACFRHLQTVIKTNLRMFSPVLHTLQHKMLENVSISTLKMLLFEQ